MVSVTQTAVTIKPNEKIVIAASTINCEMSTSMAAMAAGQSTGHTKSLHWHRSSVWPDCLARSRLETRQDILDIRVSFIDFGGYVKNEIG